MAVDNHEVSYAVDFELDEEGYQQHLLVRFTSENGSIKGRIITDAFGKSRTKIVFPVRRGWIGDPPRDGEELKVVVIHETKPEDPRRGALLVQRDLPLVDRSNYWGAQCARCTKCGKGDVRVMPPLRVGEVQHGVKLLPYPICEACGTMHRLVWSWDR